MTLHTTLIRDQIGQGLGFSIAGGKGSPPFKDGSDGIYISRLTEGGLAHRDGKILVGDKVLVVSFANRVSNLCALRIKVKNKEHSISNPMSFISILPDKRCRHDECASRCSRTASY